MTGTVTWKRRQGEWCAYGPAVIIRTGATVTVAKKSGATSEEYLAETFPATPVRDVAMAYGLPGAPILTDADAEAMEQAAREREERHAAEGCQVSMFCAGHCRTAEDHDAYQARKTTTTTHRRPRSAALCAECGTRRAVTTATDLSGLTGKVCARCKQDEGSLSFA